MPALNFKERFVEPIRSGRKAHTIRAKRKNPIHPKDILYLYCGMRRPGCFQILPEPPACTKVQEICIRICSRCNGDGEVCCSSTHYEACPVFEVSIDGQFLGRDECERLAVADGFENFSDMMKFWDGRLPFEGNIIHWR